MIQLVILSGKGGTGKTTIAAALAHLASQEMSVVLADGDVDASNLELVLAPTELAEHDFTGGQGAVIDALSVGRGVWRRTGPLRTDDRCVARWFAGVEGGWILWQRGELVRCAGHGRQCLGMGGRLVEPGLLPCISG